MTRPTWTFNSAKDYMQSSYQLGILPSFLSLADDRPAQEQIAERYGFGWYSQEGFTLAAGGPNEPYVLNYPGDPPFEELARAGLRDETIVLFPYGYVAIFQPDQTFEIARID